MNNELEWSTDVNGIARDRDWETIIAGEKISAAGMMEDIAHSGSEMLGKLDPLLDAGYNLLISKPSNW